MITKIIPTNYKIEISTLCKIIKNVVKICVLGKTLNLKSKLQRKGIHQILKEL